jgi:hypothetical protein
MAKGGAANSAVHNEAVTLASGAIESELAHTYHIPLTDVLAVMDRDVVLPQPKCRVILRCIKRITQAWRLFPGCRFRSLRLPTALPILVGDGARESGRRCHPLWCQYSSPETKPVPQWWPHVVRLRIRSRSFRLSFLYPLRRSHYRPEVPGAGVVVFPAARFLLGRVERDGCTNAAYVSSLLAVPA